MFDFLFKPKVKTYPIIKPETFTPPDAPISTADAKKLYKQVMQIIGFVEKGSMADYVRYLAEAMKQREDEIKDDFVYEKDALDEAIQNCKDDLRELKADLKAAKTDDERGVITLEIGDIESQIIEYQTDISAAKASLDSFKSDKRSFLVEYMNYEIHGKDWRSKC